MCTHMCTSAWSQRSKLNVFLNLLFCSFRQSLSLNLELSVQLDWFQLASPRVPPVSTSPALRFQAYATAEPGILHGCEGPHSSLPACLASASHSEPYVQFQFSRKCFVQFWTLLESKPSGWIMHARQVLCCTVAVAPLKEPYTQ